MCLCLYVCVSMCLCVLQQIIVVFIIRVSIVASVPGGHCGRDMLKWGHMKLRKVDTKLTNIYSCFYSFH